MMPKLLKLRYGIVQGRLIQAPPGELQWFPQQYWESEFFLASSLGIDYIELIAERQFNPGNPLWTDDGIFKIKELAQRNRLSLHAFCNDYVVEHDLIEDPEVLAQCLLLIERGALLGCEKYILPLFEASEISANNSTKYIYALQVIAEKCAENGMILCLETILNGSELVNLLSKINNSSVGVVFDTGNRVAFGHNLASDIRLLGDQIKHVHIKDKNNKNQNVLLGTGLVNFLEVFEALGDIQYKGPYTLETQRGKNPITTALFNMELVKFFYSEGYSK
ncbi:sugar phosphate isomerase/epimerase [Polynucleobacter sp. MWH-UH25E]|uniref:sugar phosphate isomerase/epimerase family protein n=1 Tax=Polynucleobacter sp. MWH-UH25E TaxID=1855616 RepID=UPI001BFE950B|nr:sugar phosphate isomerase/epimerase family protein [Polynucleobacter sp. MWH-UH25E]QWD62354.1 sugar phosphate isomerase/epimerase [Polynucleobacter sp. MWH-UH25E]